MFFAPLAVSGHGVECAECRGSARASPSHSSRSFCFCSIPTLWRGVQWGPMDKPLSPKFFRKDAYAYFVQQLPILGTTKGLLRATAAIALHALPSSQPA